MEKVKKINPRYIIDDKGDKKAVVIPIAEYKEMIEDIEDLAKAAERRGEYTISHDDLITQLKVDGLL